MTLTSKNFLIRNVGGYDRDTDTGCVKNNLAPLFVVDTLCDKGIIRMTSATLPKHKDAEDYINLRLAV